MVMKHWKKREAGIKAAKYVQDNNDISEIEKVFNLVVKMVLKGICKVLYEMANGYRLPDSSTISDIMRKVRKDDGIMGTESIYEIIAGEYQKRTEEGLEHYRRNCREGRHIAGYDKSVKMADGNRA